MVVSHAWLHTSPTIGRWLRRCSLQATTTHVRMRWGAAPSAPAIGAGIAVHEGGGQVKTCF